MTILSPRALEKRAQKHVSTVRRSTKQKAEVSRCEADPAHFINTHVFLDGLPSKPFHLYPYQRDQLKAFVSYPYVISPQPRGSGATILPLAFLLWEALFAPNRSLMVLASRDASYGYAQRQFHKNLYDMYNSLPSWLREPLTVSRVDGVQFANGSSIKFKGAEAPALQGNVGQYHRLFIDDLGSLTQRNERDFLRALIAHVSMKTELIITGAPRSHDGLYADLWGSDWSPALTFHRHFVSLNDCPQFSNAYKQQMLTSLGAKGYRHQLECDFEE